MPSTAFRGQDPPAPLPWSETRARLRRDRERLRSHVLGAGGPPPFILALHPSWLCVLLHRLSHHHFRRGRGKLSRAFWHLNMLLTGADIHPASDIGGGLLIPSPAAVSISTRAGADLTVHALGGTGSMVPDKSDVGSGPGLPVLGDSVVIGPHAGVLGPVRVGNGVVIGPGCLVTHDVDDGATIEPAPVRFLRRDALA